MIILFCMMLVIVGIYSIPFIGAFLLWTAFHAINLHENKPFFCLILLILLILVTLVIGYFTFRV